MATKSKRKLPKNIRERDGKYTYRYYVPATNIVNGAEKKTSKEKESPRFDTLEEAVNFGILIQAQKINKTLKGDIDLTVKAWGKVWLKEYILETEPSKNTIKSREYGLSVLIEEFGAFGLADITSDMYQNLLYRLKERKRSEKKQGLKRNTITAIHTAGSLMFSHAKRKGLIKEDPTEGAKVPAERKKSRKPGEKRQVLPKFLEKDELKNFLDAARDILDPNHIALFVVLAYTGLRISEAAGLQWDDDIDTIKRTIDINKQIGGRNSLNYTFEPPKNEQSERIVSYGETVAQVLEDLRIWQEEEKLSAKNFNPKDNFVFWSIRHPGYPISITSIPRIMRLALKKAALPLNLTPHSLRHTHVSILAENPKVGLAEIQARIGHSGNSKTTELIYLHVTKKRQQQMGDDFEWVING